MKLTDTSDKNDMPDDHYYSAWSALTVGVADLDAALALWVDQFGFSVVSAKQGGDSELARLWGLVPSDIVRQALLGTNNRTQGRLHLVEFDKPAEPVRKNAESFDLVPKNLDVYVANLPETVNQLQAEGYRFRTEAYSELCAADGTQFREIHLPSHDDINVVLMEIVGKRHRYTEKGVAGIGPFVFIVPDVEIEAAFFSDCLLTDKLNENTFIGPEIEKTIGLPEGTALKIIICGRPEYEQGKLEMIEYQGVSGSNLYPKATPKALGVLHVSYVVPSSERLETRLQRNSVSITKHGHIKSLIGNGNVISFASPAGLRVEVYSQQ